MKSTLVPGLTFSQSILVDSRLTVPHVAPHFSNFADMPPVFATAFMVAFMESACIGLMDGHLDEGEHSVGTAIDVSHVAATPVGMRVTATADLLEVDGRKLLFRVSARDERDLIGEGLHRRAVIRVASFMERLTAKAAT
jgi:fluoroacetyl-CoA thioesterase